MVKNLTTMQETPVRSLGQENPLEKVMVTHSSILAWRIPCTEESTRLQKIDTTERLTLSLSFFLCFVIMESLFLIKTESMGPLELLGSHWLKPWMHSKDGCLRFPWTRREKWDEGSKIMVLPITFQVRSPQGKITEKVSAASWICRVEIFKFFFGNLHVVI